MDDDVETKAVEQMPGATGTAVQIAQDLPVTDVRPQTSPKTVKHPLPQWLRRPAGRHWGYWSIHFFLAIFGATIPIYITATLIGFLGERPSDKVWKAIMGQQETVPIVMSSFGLKQFDTGYGLANLPKNVPVLGLADALGAAELVDGLSEGKPRRTPRLLVAAEYGQEHRQANFFTIGGPSVNELTGRLVASWNDQEQDPQRQYQFEQNVTLDGKLIIHYPKHYVEDYAQNDERTGKPPRRYATETNSAQRITHDFGFIIIGPNPYDRTKMVCALFGIWPQGTQAAIRTLVQPDASNANFQALLRRIARREGVVAVVETNVWNLTAEAPNIVLVRSLDPARVPAEKLINPNPQH
jgi:hypothetical protein